MSITINVTQATGGSFSAAGVTTDSINLTVGGGVGPPGAGNVALAAGDGILITSTANVATINCTVEGVPESVLENLSNVFDQNATTGDVLAYNGTAWASSSNYATLTYVDTAVANLVDAAPGALDTLNELAAAIGDDANFSATITTSLAGKAAANHTHTFQEITNGTATVTGNLTLDPSTGGVIISGGTSSGSLTLNCENNTHGVTIQSPAHSENATYTLTLPSSAGSANQVLTTDGNGSLSWSNGSSGGGSGVTTLNTLSGDLTLAAGDNVTLSTNGSTLTFSSSGGVSSLDMGTYPRGPGSLLTEGGDTLTSESGDQLLPEQATAAASAVLQLLRSNVAAAVPGSLAEGELAINTEDEVLFYVNAAGSVQSFTLGGYAAANHTHAIANVTGLQAALDAKAATASLANVATSGNYSDLAGIPSEFAPTSHASTHATGGSDALSPSDIGAAAAASPTFTGVITVSAGTAAAPAIVSGTGTSDTGVFWPAADTFAVSTAGAERLRVDSSGRVGIGGTPSYRFHVHEIGGSDFMAAGSFFYIRQANDSSCGFVVQNNVAVGGSSRGFWTFTIDGGNAANNDFLIYNSSVSPTGKLSFRMTTDGDFVLEESGGRVRADLITTAAGASGDATIGLSSQVMTISTAGSERLRVDGSGRVGIGTASPSSLLDINSDTIRLRTAKTPASASDTGNAGDICWDASYLYICTATDTWRRIAHSTW